MECAADLVKSGKNKTAKRALKNEWLLVISKEKKHLPKICQIKPMKKASHVVIKMVDTYIALTLWQVLL